MARLDANGIKELFMRVADTMNRERDALCRMDAAVGDGDLGITMSQGFTKTAESIASLEIDDVGMLIARAGMQLASVVPSTMGTLMGSGLMEAGKALKGNQEVDAPGLALFIHKFLEGLILRGKAKPGEKTVIDAFDYAARAVDKAAGKELAEIAQAAEEGAQEGLEATKAMMSTHGKAAIFREKTIGHPDPGATVGWIFIKTISGYIRA